MRLISILAFLAAPLLVTAERTIINGTDVEARQYPFVVSLQREREDGAYRHSCGGTLINRQQFLTAGHCLNFSWLPQEMMDVVMPHVPNWRVRVGSDQHAEGGYMLNISSAHVHPLSVTDGNTTQNDIVLVMLSEPVDAVITPAELPFVSQRPHIGSPVALVGWGFNVSEESGLNLTFPRTLQQIEVNVMKSEFCEKHNNKYGKQWFNATTLMCTRTQNGRDPSRISSGDSGGPMLLGRTLVGIISYRIPGVGNLGYETTVSEYLTWIDAFKLPAAA